MIVDIWISTIYMIIIYLFLFIHYGFENRINMCIVYIHDEIRTQLSDNFAYRNCCLISDFFSWAGAFRTVCIFYPVMRKVSNC